MRRKFLILAILVCFVFLTAQGCRYTDYIRGQLGQKNETEGEICVQVGNNVVCGTADELAKLQAEEKENEVEVGNVPIKEVIELDFVSFPNLRAVDPDGDKIIYNFTPPLNQKGEWQTKEGDAGEYIVTIYASDSQSTIFQDVKIVVHKFNHPPVLENIDEITVKEGDAITLEPKYSDVDKQEMTVKYSGFMDSNEYTTDYDDAGTHFVTITVSDGEKTASQDVKITVTNVNRAPVLEPVEKINAVEKDLVKINARATDPDGDALIYTFSAPFNENGEWQTGVGNQGTYAVDISVSDSSLSDSTQVEVYVEYFDKPPVFEKMEDLTVEETETVILRPLAFDPEGKELTFKFSGWMDSEVKKTTYDDSGVHEVTITASDGFNEVKQTIKVTVNNVNRAPVFAENAFE